MQCPGNWKTLVNAGLSEEELRVVRDCVGRGRPLGAVHWVLATARAAEAGLHTPRTRPAPKDNQQSVTSLFLSPSEIPGTVAHYNDIWLAKPGGLKQ